MLQPSGTARTQLSKCLQCSRRAEERARYPQDSFRSRYNYYDDTRHTVDYLYPVTNQVIFSIILYHDKIFIEGDGKLEALQPELPNVE